LIAVTAFGALTLFVSTVRPVLAGSVPEFGFERLWPALQQPWYFFNINCIEASPAGEIYICDAFRVFNADGRLIGSITLPPSFPSLGQPAIQDIEFDSNGDIWILQRRFTVPTASGPTQMFRFSDDGSFRAQVDLPDQRPNYQFSDFEIDEQGLIYALDRLNHVIQVVDASGTLQLEWGSQNRADRAALR
jgi:hypothetical protein